MLTSGPQAGEAFLLAQTLRTAGISVIEERIERTPKSSLTLAAKEARRRGISRVILYEVKKGPAASVLLLEYSDSFLKRRQTRVALQKLPQRLRTEIYGDF
ncbi:MAG: hypothetical protein JSU60_08410 [Nitrospirota bacterium]|nr:MAG: hypothetical protein JSU60_08410 [Nitrospirota bacterium]